MQIDRQRYNIDSSSEIKEETLRYLSFWPYFLLLLIFFLLISFLYIRYTPAVYNTTTTIEILDESQDSEMALPTALTVFNRSMINLENEITRLKSFELNSTVVKNNNFNIIYYKKGTIKTSETTPENWYDQYKLNLKTENKAILKRSSFTINSDNNALNIKSFDSDGKFIKSYSFSSLSTSSISHDLPFDLTIYSDKSISFEREIIFNSVDFQTNKFKKKLKIKPLGNDSDQLSVTLTHSNVDIAKSYLNELIKSFDNDGVIDKQLAYSRTIEFVNKREQILKEDLNIIELKKQNYKQDNNISDINIDANNNINLKYKYNTEIVQLESQLQIVQYLIESISDSKYEYLPNNIGLDNLDINNMIEDYNKIVSERFRYVNEAGLNNYLVKSLESQLSDFLKNIFSSLSNFSNSTNLKLSNLKLKENEFDNEYNRVPENEKTLRAIERELSVKEALYLLLLQKREEASINLAVVKPTIKVIDYAITDISSKSPSSRVIYLISIILSLIIYFSVLFIRFFLDNKVHNKDQLMKLIDDNIPIIGEIPYIVNANNIKNDSSSRSTISESIRMLLSNLRFVSSLNSDSQNKSKTIIFTSSIKGEGKTLASVNTASNLANDLNKDKRVILLGSDLRNPQIHKSFGVQKNQKGISEIIYNRDTKNYKKYVQKFQNLDVLFSGSIPPNPTALLSSNVFKDLISLLKIEYDYIIIDSAPCLLVSDTFQFIENADSVVYLFRSNFTDSKIADFINEIYNTKNIKNLNIVLNAVGNSGSYGYQYGYKYGYKYGYNYGYGYGYEADKK